MTTGVPLHALRNSNVPCTKPLMSFWSCSKFVGVVHNIAVWAPRRCWGLPLVLFITPFRFCTIHGCCWSQRTEIVPSLRFEFRFIMCSWMFSFSLLCFLFARRDFLPARGSRSLLLARWYRGNWWWSVDHNTFSLAWLRKHLKDLHLYRVCREQSTIEALALECLAQV